MISRAILSIDLDVESVGPLNGRMDTVKWPFRDCGAAESDERVESRVIPPIRTIAPMADATIGL